MLAIGSLLSGGFIWHYTSLRDELSTVKSQNVVLSESIETQRATISTLENARENSLRRVEELNRRNQQLSQDVEEYLEIFQRHDLAHLSRQRPGLIEPRINKGTKDVFRLIEKESAINTSSNND